MKKFPDLNALNMFVAVVEQKSFRIAAEQNGVTTSSVSQAIRNLEKLYNVNLFDRSLRPVGLTAAGRNFYETSLLILKAVKALDETSVLESGIYPSLRLGVSESVSETALPWILPLLKRHVRNISTVSAMTHILSEDFLREQFDILIGPSSFPDADGIYRQRVVSEDFLVLCPGDSHFTVRNKYDLREVARSLPYLSYNSSSWDNQLTKRLLRTLNIEASTSLQVESSTTLLGLISQNEGWTLMPPSNLYLGTAFASAVKIHFLEDSPLVRHQYVLTQSPGFDPLVDTIAAYYAEAIRERICPALEKINPQLKDCLRISLSNT